jgi:hypothetical protein
VIWRIQIIAALAGALASQGADTKPPELFPVSDIKAGLTGTTYTVLQGTRIDPIHTEIYGLLPNAVGPGHHLIIGRLDDEKTRTTFAVHGMSGSPLYIDGKIAGALSRRLTPFEKDAFCGFTPIQDMLEVDNPSPAPPPVVSSSKNFTGSKAWFRPLTASEGLTFQTLLTPLVVSGLPPRAFSIWAKEFADMNFLPVMGAGGSGAEARNIETPFEPGAPLAAVFARGAFHIGGTGTLTYRKGNRVYGFGHPMLMIGNARIPMARAEIIATVPSYFYPYKISRTAQVVGTITEDRLTAISGDVGPQPRMIPMSVEMSFADGQSKKYPMELFDSPFLTPKLVGDVFSSVTLLSIEYTREFSMAIEGEIVMEGLPSVKFNDFCAGEQSERFMGVEEFIRDVDDLYNNALGKPVIQRIQLKATVADQRREFEIQDVWINRDLAKPGETITARVTLRAYHGQTRVETIPILLPEEVKSGELKLLVGDADAMRRAETGSSFGGGGTGKLDVSAVSLFRNDRENTRTLTQLIELMNQARPHDFLYYRLSRTSPGQLVQSQRLTSLPPSAMAIRESRRWKDGSTKLSDAEIFEKRLPMAGVVRGSAELSIKIE